MKYTSVSCNGLDQKGTDKMILEKQVGGRKASQVLSCVGSTDSWCAGCGPGLFQKMEGESTLLCYNWGSSPGTGCQQGQRWWRGDKAN